MHSIHFYTESNGLVVEEGNKGGGGGSSLEVLEVSVTLWSRQDDKMAVKYLRSRAADSHLAMVIL